MEICILRCTLGQLKIRIPKFTVDTSKNVCKHNGENYIQFIENINEDSIISYNKDILINKNRNYFRKIIKLPLPDIVIDFIIDFIPFTILFDEIPLIYLKYFSKDKIYSYVINELNEEKNKYHEEKIYYMYDDDWEYQWCKDCVDRVEEEIIKFENFRKQFKIEKN